MDEFFIFAAFEGRDFAFHGRELARKRGRARHGGVPEAVLYHMGDDEVLFTFDEAGDNADMADQLAPDDPAWQASLRRSVTFAIAVTESEVTDEWLARAEDDWGVPQGMLSDLWNEAWNEAVLRSRRPDADASQVLDVLRDVLVEHMDDDDALPHYRVEAAVMIGKRSGRPITEDNVIDGSDAPDGILLTMRNGAQYRLTLRVEGGDDA